MGWLWWGLLYGVIFCIFFAIQIVLIGLLDNYISDQRLRSADPLVRLHHYRRRTHFYHMFLDDAPQTRSQTTTNPSSLIDADFRKGHVDFDYGYDGLRIKNGLPKLDPQTNLIVLHVSGGWLGLFPNWPQFNHVLNGHARPIHDTIARYAHLKLPGTVPIISFRNPTDAVYALNFAGQDDQMVMDDIFHTLIAHLPSHCKMIVASDCLGGLRFLRWWEQTTSTQDPQNNQLRSRIVGAVFESPLGTSNRVFRPSRWSAINNLFGALLQFSLPNFVPDDGDYLPHYQCNIPSIVTLIEGDRFCDTHDLEWILKSFTKMFATVIVPKNQLSETGRTIEHGHAYRWPAFKLALFQLVSHLLKR